LKNLTTAIYGQLAGSAFATDINSRMFKGQAPEGTTYPYAVYMVVTDVPDHTFSEDFEDVIVQFSLFSSASGTEQIEDMYADLLTLYDENDFSIEEEDLIWMRESNTAFLVEDHTTPTGTQRIWAYHVSFDVKTLNEPYAVVWMDTPDVIFEDTTGVEFRNRS